MNSSCSKSQNWVLIFWVDLLLFFKGLISLQILHNQIILLTLYVHVCGYVDAGSHMWRSGYNLEELNHLTLLGYLLPVCGLILELICSHWPK